MFSSTEFAQTTFQILKSGKQECVFALTLCDPYFSHVFRMVNRNLTLNTGVSILSRDDENFFNLSHFNAKAQTDKVPAHKLLSADDAALNLKTSSRALVSFFQIM